MLGSKSDQEIRELLDEYGIKHGPVVDSTRSLYEKKLKEAMAKEKTSNLFSAKTSYREEEEEVVYYRTPVRNEGSGDRRLYIRPRPEYTEKQFVGKNLSDTKPTPSKSGGDTLKEEPGSSRLIPLRVQFLVFLIVAGFLYVVFSNMESATSEPFKGIQ